MKIIIRQSQINKKTINCQLKKIKQLKLISVCKYLLVKPFHLFILMSKISNKIKNKYMRRRTTQRIKQLINFNRKRKKRELLTKTKINNIKLYKKEDNNN